MRQRVITGALFAVGVAAFVIPSYWVPFLMIVFAAVVGAVCFYEMIKAIGNGQSEPSNAMMIIGGIIALILAVVCSCTGMDLAVALALYLLIEGLYVFMCAIIPSVVRTDGNHIADGLVTGGVVFYLTFPLFCLCVVSTLPENGWLYMVPALAGAWISDTCAYFAGVTLGKHKIVPHISPKKTWEGCVGGAVGCALIVMLYFDIVVYGADGISMNIVLFSLLTFVLGFLMSVMSQLGDWTASLIKRQVGIKDYGNIFPGHGGMMDRFDSTLFTIPTGVLIAIAASFLT